jgi:ketosteroid isomerase-like protein
MSSGTTGTRTQPGANSALVRKMFEGGESMNVHNFAALYADDAWYQFGNFPVARGPQGIIEASGSFLAKVKQVVHHIENMWEMDDETVVCEMTVTYERHDGKSFTLPCCDTIKIRDGKVQMLKIYMDIGPVFAD